MILGQTIRAVTGAASTYYGPWFPAEGASAVFVCNVVYLAAASLTIQIQTKKRGDDNDALVDLGSPETIATAIHAFERGVPVDGSAPGLRELVRYKYTLTSSASQKGWCHLRMLDPAWEAD